LRRRICRDAIDVAASAEGKPSLSASRNASRLRVIAADCPGDYRPNFSNRARGAKLSGLVPMRLLRNWSMSVSVIRLRRALRCAPVH